MQCDIQYIILLVMLMNIQLSLVNEDGRKLTK